MRLGKWIFLALCWVLVLCRVDAHDVVWTGNPFGFNPQEPLRVQFGTNELIQVKPVTGEPCIVAVNLDSFASTLVRVEVITANPALQVEIRVTPLRAATNASEVVMLSGEWHATGAPIPQECTATFPNRFTVPIRVLGGPPVATIGDVTPHFAPGSSLVTITGSGFTGATEVMFGGVKATNFSIVNDSTINVTVPSNAFVGKVSVTTTAGKSESAFVFVPQPELKVMPTINATMVRLQWNNRNYPFTLQRSTAITGAPWTDWITTLDNTLNIPVENGPAFYRLSWMEIPLDWTDYNSDRAPIAQFYHRDPINYWATYGIPSLARLAMIRDDLNVDRYAPFQGFLQGFDQQRFMNLLQSNAFPTVVSTTVSNELSGGASVTNAYVNTLIKLVQSNDATNCIDIFRTNCLVTNSLAPVFTRVMTNLTSSNTWTGTAPVTNKAFFNSSQTNNRSIAWIDTHGTHAFTQTPRPVATPNTNATVKTKWTDVTSSTFSTTFNGACASLAVGASLAKMGVVADDSSAFFWNELSRLIGATPGTLGALSTDVADFYGTVGYGASEAYDGPIESAVQEAKKALDRGCDVQIYYYSADDTRGHTEFVTGITIDPSDSTKATISTLSWGGNATVAYDGNITGGHFGGKSDGQRYRKSTETSSWLEQSGTAELHYFCKK